MDRWIISAYPKRGEKAYCLPRRCPNCRSLDIFADIRDGAVHEWCVECDRNNTYRLVRVEAARCATRTEAV
jgi:hypothetical protein